MHILVAIPLLYNGEMCEEAINSVVHKEHVSVLLIDNGSENDVKKVINKFSVLPNVHIIRNEKNLFVNPAWNQSMDFFLRNLQFTHIAIMNSDLVMHNLWDWVLLNRLLENPDEISIPRMIDDKYFGGMENTNSDVCNATEVHSGTAGVFILMNRKHVGIVNPIPSEILCWFGDNYLYSILRELGYKTVIPDNFLCYHAHSQTIQRVKGISEIIEEDKRQWANVVEPKMNELIARYK